ncbi:short-subunit dehydrogenase [Marinobacterium halophilum]|uniref:Short-subunit dehydrogenase n=1 Tax=Marinobacterium halophilum TaxID=267374 RepID=A0A2P8F3I9_9GAMM|nr:SDR family oxidoreductase [Marinobacterium halophilum]PSL16266.1 short-subunit dehydrogenase [Marinobacterium halophilum]
MQFDRRHILITGASGGIGSALAHALAAEKASLLLHGRNAQALTALADECRQLGAGNVQTCIADLTTAEGRGALVSHVQRDFLRLDTLINNAGISRFQLFNQQTPGQIEQLLASNINAPVLLTHALITSLLETQGEPPVILNIGSAFGAIGFPGYSTYCASKGALRLFTEALAREYSDTALRVQYLAPRATRTRINSDRANAMTAATGSSIDSPECVAQAALQLLRSGHAQAAIGWPEKLLVRLNGLRPELISRVLRKQLAKIKTFANQPDTGA